jgi:hypothetical protein
MIMTFKGRGEKGGELPVALPEAKPYFTDIKAFLHKIEDVREVKELGRPGAYLVKNHPVGALNYYVDVVWAIQIEPTDDGMVIRPLDFDLEKIKSDNQVVKSMVDGELKLKALAADRTGVDFWFTFAVEFPVPGALRLVPSGLIQTTADGIMNVRVSATVGNLYGKVVEDFALPV